MFSSLCLNSNSYSYRPSQLDLYQISEELPVSNTSLVVMTPASGSGSVTANTATVHQVDEDIPVATNLVSVLVDPVSTPSGVPPLPPLLVDGKLCSDTNPFSSNTVVEEGYSAAVPVLETTSL